jgi:drug/metabolite transporter (DMT)-like permease
VKAAATTIARGDLVALVLAATCWGLGTVLSKAALEEIPALALLPIQLAVSLVVLIGLMRWRGVPLRGGGPALLGRLGLLNPGLAYALSLIGLMTITASLSVLLWMLEPLLILFLAAWFLRERITSVVVLLSLVAVAGMVLIVFDPTGTNQLVGVALTVAGVACCAVYTVVTRRWIPEARETGQVVLAQQAHGLLFALGLAAVAAAAGTALVPVSLTPIGVTSAAASGALYYAGAYWFYLGALRNVPASIASSSYYLIPIVGILASALILGERLDLRQWVGTAVVLAAVLAIARQPTAVPEVALEPGGALAD